MTVLATPPDATATAAGQPSIERPRPGSRADRASTPKARAILKALAEHYKVCVRPLALRRIDNETGLTEVVDIPCGARLASKCAPCAERNQRLRRQQIREGWHLADEPDPAPEPASEEVLALVRLRCQFVFDREQAQREADWSGVAELDPTPFS